MHRDNYTVRTGGSAQGHRNRQSCILHAMDLCRTARSHSSTDDGLERHAGRRAADWPVWRRWSAAADGSGAGETTFRKIMARDVLRGGAVVVLLFLSLCGAAVAAEPFPFGRVLLLDAAPMRPGKRMPILTVEANGEARIDLWCRTVPARVEIADMAVKIEAGPLPEELPAMQGTGQCTPERIKADEEMLASIVQVTEWRQDGDTILLIGQATLKFRPATN